MSRPHVGFVMTAAARKRYADEVSVRRLEEVADVVWLDLDGPDRVFGPPPEDAATVARLTVGSPLSVDGFSLQTDWAEAVAAATFPTTSDCR